jgi:hypothetical protein
MGKLPGKFSGKTITAQLAMDQARLARPNPMPIEYGLNT